MSERARTSQEQGIRLAAAGALLDRVLHDLKQPMNLIRVIAQDVRLDAQRQRLELPSVVESMAEIERSIDQAVFGLEQLRAFARPCREAATSSLDVACTKALERIRQSYPAAELHVELALNLPSVPIRELDIEQSIYELVDNGLRAALEAGREPARVIVSTARVDNNVVINVQDNGPGVPEAVRRRLPEPTFLQHGGSAGLGLPLVAALARNAGGHVEIVSSGGEGTVFQLCLPLRA